MVGIADPAVPRTETADVVPLHRGAAAPSGPPPAISHPLGLDRRADWHTHSDLARGGDTAISVADAAQAAGLTTWGLSDRVTASSSWIGDYAAMVRTFRRDGLTVRCGVETGLLDVRGRLDLPPGLPFLDYAILTAESLPGRDGPVAVSEVRAALHAGSVRPDDIVGQLVTATVSGVRNCPARPVVGRLFSLLPQVGIEERAVTDQHLAAIAAACRDTGGAVEVNERWRAPSARVATYLAAAGVALRAGSDARFAREVGAWRYVDGITGVEASDLAEIIEIDAYGLDDAPFEADVAMATA